MRIWVDLANSPHVPFFRPLIDEFERRGHAVEVTARDFAQTIELAEQAGLRAAVVGSHGGRELRGKASNLVARALSLRGWAKKSGAFDLAVGHNSYSQIVAARLRGIRAVTLMDYEHQPANHLAFRLASRVIVPAAFPEEALDRFGARQSRGKVRRYRGIKEDVYLADFAPDEKFKERLAREFGIGREDVLIVVRPPASEALYHRFENELFDALLARLLAAERAKVILLARSAAQGADVAAKHGGSRSGADGGGAANLIFPPRALDGSNLIAAADLVVSAGGTMNREAAALGTPAATVYAGRWAAVDEQLVREKRLRRIADPKDVQNLRVEKKSPGRDAAADDSAGRRSTAREEVANLILDPFDC